MVAKLNGFPHNSVKRKQSGAAGLHTRRSDINRGGAGSLFDFETPEGFLLAMKQVLRLRPNGLLWLGIPCNSILVSTIVRKDLDGRPQNNSKQL